MYINPTNVKNIKNLNVKLLNEDGPIRNYTQRALYNSMLICKDSFTCQQFSLPLNIHRKHKTLFMAKFIT